MPLIAAELNSELKPPLNDWTLLDARELMPPPPAPFRDRAVRELQRWLQNQVVEHPLEAVSQGLEEPFQLQPPGTANQ